MAVMTHRDVGKQVILAGKTRHGKNRIQQHGKLWTVLGVGTFNGRPAMQLQSENKTEGAKGNKGFDSRWVHLADDNNFEWDHV